MPNVSTSGGGGFLSGLGDAFAGLGAGIGEIFGAAASNPLTSQILNRVLPQQSLPGGSPVVLQLPGSFADPRLAQAQQASALSLLPALLPSARSLVPFGAGALGSELLDLFGTSGGGGVTIRPRSVESRPRLPSRVDVPVMDAAGNQRFVAFKNMGRPVLFSGDIAACKRVKRIAKRTRKAVGGQ